MYLQETSDMGKKRLTKELRAARENAKRLKMEMHNTHTSKVEQAVHMDYESACTLKKLQELEGRENGLRAILTKQNLCDDRTNKSEPEVGDYNNDGDDNIDREISEHVCDVSRNKSESEGEDDGDHNAYEGDVGEENVCDGSRNESEPSGYDDDDDDDDDPAYEGDTSEENSRGDSRNKSEPEGYDDDNYYYNDDPAYEEDTSEENSRDDSRIESEPEYEDDGDDDDGDISEQIAGDDSGNESEPEGAAAVAADDDDGNDDGGYDPVYEEYVSECNFDDVSTNESEPGSNYNEYAYEGDTTKQNSGDDSRNDPNPESNDDGYYRYYCYYDCDGRGDGDDNDANKGDISEQSSGDDSKKKSKPDGNVNEYDTASWQCTIGRESTENCWSPYGDSMKRANEGSEEVGTSSRLTGAAATCGN
jgi:hypothetical protein